MTSIESGTKNHLRVISDQSTASELTVEPLKKRIDWCDISSDEEDSLSDARRSYFGHQSVTTQSTTQPTEDDSLGDRESLLDELQCRDSSSSRQSTKDSHSAQSAEEETLSKEEITERNIANHITAHQQACGTNTPRHLQNFHQMGGWFPSHSRQHSWRTSGSSISSSPGSSHHYLTADSIQPLHLNLRMDATSSYSEGSATPTTYSDSDCGDGRGFGLLWVEKDAFLDGENMHPLAKPLSEMSLSHGITLKRFKCVANVLRWLTNRRNNKRRAKKNYVLVCAEDSVGALQSFSHSWDYFATEDGAPIVYSNNSESLINKSKANSWKYQIHKDTMSELCDIKIKGYSFPPEANVVFITESFLDDEMDILNEKLNKTDNVLQFKNNLEAINFFRQKADASNVLLIPKKGKRSTNTRIWPESEPRYTIICKGKGVAMREFLRCWKGTGIAEKLLSCGNLEEEDNRLNTIHRIDNPDALDDLLHDVEDAVATVQDTMSAFDNVSYFSNSEWTSQADSDWQPIDPILDCDIPNTRRRLSDIDVTQEVDHIPSPTNELTDTDLNLLVEWADQNNEEVIIEEVITDVHGEEVTQHHPVIIPDQKEETQNPQKPWINLFRENGGPRLVTGSTDTKNTIKGGAYPGKGMIAIKGNGKGFVVQKEDGKSQTTSPGTNNGVFGSKGLSKGAAEIKAKLKVGQLHNVQKIGCRLVVFRTQGLAPPKGIPQPKWKGKTERVPSSGSSNTIGSTGNSTVTPLSPTHSYPAPRSSTSPKPTSSHPSDASLDHTVPRPISSYQTRSSTSPRLTTQGSESDSHGPRSVPSQIFSRSQTPTRTVTTGSNTRGPSPTVTASLTTSSSRSTTTTGSPGLESKRLSRDTKPKPLRSRPLQPPVRVSNSNVQNKANNLGNQRNRLRISALQAPPFPQLAPIEEEK